MNDERRPDSLWTELVRIALLGTERATLPDELARELVQAGIAEEDEAQWLLHALSWTWLRQRAGFALEAWHGPLPEPPVQAQRQPLQPSGEALLHELLRPAFRKGLPEFLWLMRQRKRRIPEALWPDLLDLCVEMPTLWQALAPLAGRFGRWIALQHLPWLKAVTDAPRSLSEATRDSWLELLQLRKTPNAAFAKRWKALFDQQPSWQEALIRLLQRHLQAEDQTLAEHALRQAAPQARFAAAALCAQFPDHPLGEALADTLSRILQIRRAQLVVAPSWRASLQKWRTRLSTGTHALDALPTLPPLHDRTPPLPPLDDGQLLLWHAIAAAPPTLLLKRMGCGPDSWVAAARAHELGEVLLLGSTLAAARHRYQPLLDRLWRYWLDRPQCTPLWHRALPPLLDLTPSDRYSAIMLEALERHPALDEPTPAVHTLAKAEKAWSDALATHVWKRLGKKLCARHNFLSSIFPSASTELSPLEREVLRQAAWRTQLHSLQRLLSRICPDEHEGEKFLDPHLREICELRNRIAREVLK